MESLTVPTPKSKSRINMSKDCSECGKAGVLARGLCSTHYSYWHRETKGRTIQTHDKVCKFCAKDFCTTTPKTAYCSEACAQRHRSGWSTSKELTLWVAPAKEEAPTRHIRTANRWMCGPCAACGTYFIGRYGSMSCSTKCDDTRIRESRHAASHRRRALEKAAYVAPVYRKKVFAADGYRCHICHKMTKRHAVVPDPKAPTVDHLIPLSKGGTHEPSNCRTAHFLCNSNKGDRLAGDQLILFNV